MVVKFNKDGDSFGSYDIFQYQRISSNASNGNKLQFDYVSIGEWTNDQ